MEAEIEQKELQKKATEQQNPDQPIPTVQEIMRSNKLKEKQEKEKIELNFVLLKLYHSKTQLISFEDCF